MRALCVKIKESFPLKYLTIALCTALTCYIMFKVVHNFMIIRPTSSSEENAHLHSSTFPEIVLCVEPALNLSMLEKQGYKDSWAYYTGRNVSFKGNFVGWSVGKLNNDPLSSLEKMLKVHIKDGGLVSEVFHVENGVYVLKNPTLKWRMMAFPHFRCQVVKLSTKGLNISALDVYMETANIMRLTGTKENKIQIFLMDSINSPLIFTASFQMKGTPILMDLKEKSYHNYLVKISQLRHVEGNPNFDCKDYSEDDTYGGCIEEEFRRKLVSILNCTPPWVPSSRICNKEMQIGEDETDKLDEIFYIDQDLNKL